jgi:hypothetical protein
VLRKGGGRREKGRVLASTIDFLDYCEYYEREFVFLPTYQAGTPGIIWHLV